MIRDVIIIGGGPGGLATGRLLAAEGFDVALFEEHPSSGEPVHCTGVLAAEAFDDPVVPRDVILNPLRTARFFAPCGASISHTTETTEAVVVDRARLDRALFAAARDAGVEVLNGRRATSVSIETDGVTVTLSDGVTVRARACVLACGAQVLDSTEAWPWHPDGLPAVGAGRSAGRVSRGRRGPLRAGRCTRRVRMGGARHAAVWSARARWPDVRPRCRPLFRSVA